ncbi:Hsp20/alpha crystallin family protein [Candidatus Uhrbacteria bacterium]|nr:Hsp20/alpha crystallin family protein [Candidatus Uhrbacteria bacterium]
MGTSPFTFPSFPATVLNPESLTIPVQEPAQWFEEASEGELAVDVYETTEAFVIQTAMGGVRPNDLSIAIHRDLLTIRGERRPNTPDADASYLTRECYWGRFSRSMLLPEPVDVPHATADLSYGILTIRLPKLVEQTVITITDATPADSTTILG